MRSVEAARTSAVATEECFGNAGLIECAPTKAALDACNRAGRTQDHPRRRPRLAARDGGGQCPGLDRSGWARIDAREADRGGGLGSPDETLGGEGHPLEGGFGRQAVGRRRGSGRRVIMAAGAPHRACAARLAGRVTVAARASFGRAPARALADMVGATLLGRVGHEGSHGGSHDPEQDHERARPPKHHGPGDCTRGSQAASTRGW
jgi:hypothetical protein